MDGNWAAGSIPNGVIGIFIALIFPVALVPGVDEASKRNYHQEYFMRVKAACV